VLQDQFGDGLSSVNNIFWWQ